MEATEKATWDLETKFGPKQEGNAGKLIQTLDYRYICSLFYSFGFGKRIHEGCCQFPPCREGQREIIDAIHLGEIYSHKMNIKRSFTSTLSF